MVAGILNIVLGALLLAWGVVISLLVHVITLYASVAFGKEEQLAGLGMSAWQMVVLCSALPAVQIAAGILLLVCPSWGRWLTLIWAGALAVLGLPVEVFGWGGGAMAAYAVLVVAVLFAPWWRSALKRPRRADIAAEYKAAA